MNDFYSNLINLIGDVRKNWSARVKSEQSVTETTEKLREVLQISKNYIELIDKSVIDEYFWLLIKVDCGAKFLFLMMKHLHLMKIR